MSTKRPPSAWPRIINSEGRVGWQRLAGALLVGALVGCSDEAGPSQAAPGFSITVVAPGQPGISVRGDSTEWTTNAVRDPLFASSMVSPDSIGVGSAPTSFYFNQWWPILENGGLAGGHYLLAPNDSTGRVFGLCYLAPGSTQVCASSDSGSVTIAPPTGDSIIRGSVEAWVTEYRVTTPQSFRVWGEFRLRPRP